MVAATALSPASGPVAVTGASGYIGSWVVQDLVATHGACSLMGAQAVESFGPAAVSDTVQ
jgi:uncharacterized protein YbjT (DUF2867 family)